MNEAFKFRNIQSSLRPSNLGVPPRASGMPSASGSPLRLKACGMTVYSLSSRLHSRFLPFPALLKHPFLPPFLPTGPEIPHFKIFLVIQFWCDCRPYNSCRLTNVSHLDEPCAWDAARTGERIRQGQGHRRQQEVSVPLYLAPILCEVMVRFLVPQPLTEVAVLNRQHL